jgi:wyosine [tRNA(Phe)-imidazoG37] synthetase (radical SAM superfamily)
MKKGNVKEWSPAKKWNPFNSYKLLAQVYRWRLIQEGKKIPQPALITIDPINSCNLKCSWCNADYILKENQGMISRASFLKIADFLPKWNGTTKWGKGVDAICIAGGGEPLMNPHVGEFIEKCVENGIEVGVVTNGSLIDKFIEPLSKITWVGVSIDAGTRETFSELKKADLFEKTTENIKQLVDYSKENKTRLSLNKQGYGVSYKYLLHPKNIPEIHEAAKIAKQVGCKNFHMRPVGIPWSDIKDESKKEFYSFNEKAIEEFGKQTKMARELEDENFGVFGVTHKFDNTFNPANTFKDCYAVFMTGVLMPGSDSNEDSFTFGLCCDRRGDKKLLLEENITDPNNVAESWGGKKHWDIFRNLGLKSCPRCTYQPHNQIYEHVIKDDSMTYKFI